MTRASTILALLVLGLTGCTDSGADAPDPEGSSSASPSAEPPEPPEPAAPGEGASDEVLLEDLEASWEVVRLGSNLWLSERDGELVRVDQRGGSASWRTPTVARGEGGLLGLAVDPTRTWMYVYTSREDDNAVLRTPLLGPGEFEEVLTGIPVGNTHNGGRMVFGPDRMLYIGTGDAGESSRSQDPDSLGGKVLRVTPEGEVPSDNPSGNAVWTLGHRNVQGLAFDESGRLWASEFGQNTFDELNLLSAGGNYGWPVVEGRGGDARFVEPLVVWTPEEASPSGIAVFDGAVWVAALRGERVWKVEITEDGVGEVSVARDDLGRVRSVVNDRDGLLVVTGNTDGRGDPRSGDDKVLRWVP